MFSTYPWASSRTHKRYIIVFYNYCLFSTLPMSKWKFLTPFLKQSKLHSAIKKKKKNKKIRFEFFFNRNTVIIWYNITEYCFVCFFPPFYVGNLNYTTIMSTTIFERTVYYNVWLHVKTIMKSYDIFFPLRII